MNNSKKLFIIFCLFLSFQLFINASCFAADTVDYNNVEINKVWHIKFNLELNKNTINLNNIMILDENQKGVAVNISCSSDNRSVTISPVKNYDYGKTYTLIITKNVQAISGKSIENSKEYKFATKNHNTSSFKVCLDAGYGGTSGKESSINLSVALKAGKILQSKGIQVFYARTSDVNVDMPSRFKVANDNNVNYFISIHCNSYTGNNTASGIETYYLDGNSKGKEAAASIQSKLVKSTGLTDRGAKSGQYAEVKSTNAPGIKIYLGFLTTPSDEKLLESEDFQNKCAAAIAQGIASEYNISDFANNLSGNAASDAIIAYAYKFLGTPYLYGGTTPSGFDCSGFVQYVYAHFGINISRDTYHQIKDGTFVNKDNLMPGDLIFFGTYDNPHHVGLYIGNNQYIHSPSTNDVVKISSLKDATDYLCARRILK